jgi:hypothetical protein
MNVCKTPIYEAACHGVVVVASTYPYQATISHLTRDIYQ